MSHFTIVSLSKNQWSVNNGSLGLIRNNVVPACRGCLEIDTKLVPLEGRTGEVFYKFTGIPLTGGLRYLCVVCLALLKKFDNFRKRCRMASLSIRRIEVLKPVTPTDIKKIDNSYYKYELNRTPTEVLNIEPAITQTQQSGIYQRNLNKQNKTMENLQYSHYKIPQHNQARNIGNGNAKQNKTMCNRTFGVPNLVDYTQVREVAPKAAETGSPINFPMHHPLLSLSQLNDNYGSRKEITSNASFTENAGMVKPIKILPKPVMLLKPIKIIPKPSTVVQSTEEITKRNEVVIAEKQNQEMITDVKLANKLDDRVVKERNLVIMPVDDEIMEDNSVDNIKENESSKEEEIITDVKVENELDDIFVKEENLVVPVDDESMEDNSVDYIKENESSKEKEYTKEIINSKEIDTTKKNLNSEVIEIVDEDSSSSSSSSDSESSSSSNDESDLDDAKVSCEPEKVQIDLTLDDEVILKENDEKIDKISDKKVTEGVKEDEELLPKYVAAENTELSAAETQIKTPETETKLSNCEIIKQEESEEEIKEKLKNMVSDVSELEVTAALEQEDKMIEVKNEDINNIELQQTNKMKDQSVTKPIERKENKEEHKVTESLPLEKNKMESEQVPKEIEQEKNKMQDQQVTKTVKQNERKHENIPVMHEESNVESIEQEQQISEALEQELNNALKEIIPVEAVQKEIRTTYKISAPENFKENLVSNLEEVREECTANELVVIKEESEDAFDNEDLQVEGLNEEKLVVEEIILSDMVDVNENRGETLEHVEEVARINILQSALLSAGIDETDLRSTPQKRRHENNDSDGSDASTDLPDCLMGINSEIYKNDRPLKTPKVKPVKLFTPEADEEIVKEVKKPRVVQRKSRRIAEMTKHSSKETNLKKDEYDLLLMKKSMRQMERKNLSKEVKDLRAMYKAKLSQFLAANRSMRKLENKFSNDAKGGVAVRLARKREFVKNIRLTLRRIKDSYLKKKIEEIEMESSSDDDYF